MGFETKRLHSGPNAIAPDGSEVRVLCQLSRGGLAVFSLPPNAVSKAVAHRTVEEVWYIVSGKGRMWRKLGDQDEIAELGPGVSLTIPELGDLVSKTRRERRLSQDGLATKLGAPINRSTIAHLEQGLRLPQPE